MMRPPAVPDGRVTRAVVLFVVGAVGLLAGCSPPQSEGDDVERTARCTELAASVTRIGLAGSPTQKDAQEGHQRLDTQILLLPDPSVREASSSLHFHLHILDFALGTRDQTQAVKSLQDTRTDTTDLAKACRMTPADFGLG